MDEDAQVVVSELWFDGCSKVIRETNGVRELSVYDEPQFRILKAPEAAPKCECALGSYENKYRRRTADWQGSEYEYNAMVLGFR